MEKGQIRPLIFRFFSFFVVVVFIMSIKWAHSDHPVIKALLCFYSDITLGQNSFKLLSLRNSMLITLKVTHHKIKICTSRNATLFDSMLEVMVWRDGSVVKTLGWS